MRTTLMLAVLPLVPVDLDLSWSDGVLGSAIDYQLDGDASEPAILLPSFTAGPTPLSIFFAGETRVLDVGLDLLAIAPLVLLDPVGQGAVSFPLPADPTLSGLVLRAQAVSLDLTGTGSPFDDISDAVSASLALPGDLIPTVSQPFEARRGHSSVRLADGRVLLMGGELVDALGNANSTDSFEIYDPVSDVFALGASTMVAARSRQTSTLLADGRVLTVGGAQDLIGTGAAAQALASTELFDPGTLTFAAGPAMASPRVHHTATLLLDGRVLVVGGRSDSINLGHSLGGSDFGAVFPATTEIFDPVGNTWVAGPSLPAGRIGHSATPLSDGTVLIAGGRVVGTPIFGFTPTISTDEVLIFDPVTNSISTGVALPEARAHHTAVLSADGGVFLTGGLSSVIFFPPSVAVYDNAGLSTLIYSDPMQQWGPQPEPGGVTYSGESFCVDVGGGCFDYVVIDCPDDDMVNADGSLSQDRIVKVQICGAGPLTKIDDLFLVSDGTGHSAVIVEEISRIIIAGNQKLALSFTPSAVMYSYDC